MPFLAQDTPALNGFISETDYSGRASRAMQAGLYRERVSNISDLLSFAVNFAERPVGFISIATLNIFLGQYPEHRA